MNSAEELLNIVYSEAGFVVVNKVSGMLAVPGRGPDMQDCVTNRLKKIFPKCIEQPSVHRLDMDTSGLMVLALNQENHRNLSIQFQQRIVKKLYIALLDGVITAESGEISLPFRLDPDNRPYQIYDPIHGKMGHTKWRKIAVEGKHTRIEYTPLTGRTHQLRLHSAHDRGLGHPIVGDRLYGSGTQPGQLKLHASKLEFLHPNSDHPLTFTAPPPF